MGDSTDAVIFKYFAVTGGMSAPPTGVGAAPSNGVRDATSSLGNRIQNWKLAAGSYPINLYADIPTGVMAADADTLANAAKPNGVGGGVRSSKTDSEGRFVPQLKPAAAIDKSDGVMELVT